MDKTRVKIIESVSKNLAIAQLATILTDLYARLPDVERPKRNLTIAEKIGFIMDRTSYLVAITDPQNAKFVCVNSVMIKGLGFSFHELTTTNYFNFIHPDDVGKSMEAMEDVSIYGTGIDKYATFENRYKCKDGTYATIKWHIHNDYDQNKKIFLSIAEIEKT